MSRRTPVKELLGETPIPDSPRRSTRIAAVTRRRSMSEEPEVVPARATRSKRNSLSQDCRASLDSKDSIVSTDVSNEVNRPSRITRSRGSFTLDEEERKAVGSPIIPKSSTRLRTSARRSVSPSHESSEAPIAAKRRGRLPSITERINALESIEEADAKQLEDSDDVTLNSESVGKPVKKNAHNLQAIAEKDEKLDRSNLAESEDVPSTSPNKNLDKSDIKTSKRSSSPIQKECSVLLPVIDKPTNSPNTSLSKNDGNVKPVVESKNESVVNIKDSDEEESIHLVTSDVEQNTENLDLSNTSDKENQLSKKRQQTPSKTSLEEDLNVSRKRNSSIKNSFSEPLDSLDDYPPDTDSEIDVTKKSLSESLNSNSSKSTRNLSNRSNKESQNVSLDKSSNLLKDGQQTRMSPKIHIISNNTIQSSPKQTSSTPIKSLNEKNRFSGESKNLNKSFEKISSPLNTSIEKRNRSLSTSLSKNNSISSEDNVSKHDDSPNKKKRSLSMSLLKSSDRSKSDEEFANINKSNSSERSIQTRSQRFSSPNLSKPRPSDQDGQAITLRSGTKIFTSNELVEKVDEFLKNADCSDSDSSEAGFLDKEAIECEESNSSEDSNYIPEKGESIGSSDSNSDSNESYQRDSFLVDSGEECTELLSGDEYDLSQQKKNKEAPLKGNRICTFKDSDSENEVVDKASKKQDQVEHVQALKLSSDECNLSQQKKKEEPVEQVQNLKLVNGELAKRAIQKEKDDESDLEKMSTQPYCGLSPPSIPSIQESLSEVDKIDIKDQDSNESIVNKEDNLESLEVLKSDRNSLLQNSCPTVNVIPTPKKPDEPSNTPNRSLKMDESIISNQSRRSITITENVNFENLVEGNISDRISKVVDVFCSSMKQTGEDTAGNISLNISLEFKESPVVIGGRLSFTEQENGSRRQSKQVDTSQSNNEPGVSQEISKKSDDEGKLVKKNAKRSKRKRKHQKDLQLTDQKADTEEINLPSKSFKKTKHSYDNDRSLDSDMSDEQIEEVSRKEAENKDISQASLESDMSGEETEEMPIPEGENKDISLASLEPNISDEEIEEAESKSISQSSLDSDMSDEEIEELATNTDEESSLDSNMSHEEIEVPTQEDENKYISDTSDKEMEVPKKESENNDIAQASSDSDMSDDLDESINAKYNKLKSKSILKKDIKNKKVVCTDEDKNVSLQRAEGTQLNSNSPLKKKVLKRKAKSIGGNGMIPSRKSIGGKLLDINYFPSVILNDLVNSKPSKPQFPDTSENLKPLKRQLSSTSSDPVKLAKEQAKKQTKKPRLLPTAKLLPNEQKSWQCNSIQCTYQPSSSMFTPKARKIDKKDFKNQNLKHITKRTTAEEIMRQRHKAEML